MFRCAKYDQNSSCRSPWLTTVQLKILRPVGDRLVVIRESRNIGIRQAGLVKQKLPHSVGVEKGDVPGYYLPHGNSAIFDTGTGDPVQLSTHWKMHPDRGFFMAAYQ